MTAPVLEAVLVEVVDTLGEERIGLGGLKGDTRVFFLLEQKFQKTNSLFVNSCNPEKV